MLTQTRNPTVPNFHTGPVKRTPRTGLAMTVPIHVVPTKVRFEGEVEV